MKNKISIILIFFSSILFGQNALENPLEIKSEGEMPESLIQNLEKSNDDILNYFYINGKLVYGSKLNQYLGKIADNVLKNYPELRKEITIFVGKSTTVNAYANSNGCILINIGLIAQVSNEAELAFVISHEIVHYFLKHKYLDTDYKNSINNFLAHHLASREQENEADLNGIELFYSSSNYNYEALDGAFDVLQYGYLPFDNIPFERNFVETEYYQFPDKYFLNNINPINNRDNFNDTLCTHPNLAKRRVAIKNIVASKDNSGRSNFMQSESLFNQIQTAARLECIKQWIVNHKFADAYYNSYILMKKEKYQEYDNFLKNAMAISVYGMSKHKYNGTIRDILKKISDIEGEKQNAFNFFNELTRQEFSVLALRLLWTAKKETPNNIIFDKLCANIISDMIENDKLKLSSFCDYPMGTVLDSISDTPLENLDTQQNKYDRIKQQNIVKVKPSPKFKTVNYMLSDLKQDDNFIAFFQEIQNRMEDEKVLALISKGSIKYNDENVVFLNPAYIYKTKKEKTKDVKSQERMEKSLSSSAKSLKINHSMMDNKNINKFTSVQYNDFCKLYDWLEYAYNINVGIEAYFTLDIKNIMPDCKFLIITSTYSDKEKIFQSSDVWTTLISAVFYPTFPANASKMFFSRRTIQVYFSVINLENAKVVLAKDEYYQNRTSSDALLHAFLYDCLYQLKNGGKNEK